jgi:hypothetical protein
MAVILLQGIWAAESLLRVRRGWLLRQRFRFFDQRQEQETVAGQILGHSSLNETKGFPSGVSHVAETLNIIGCHGSGVRIAGPPQLRRLPESSG